MKQRFLLAFCLASATTHLAPLECLFDGSGVSDEQERKSISVSVSEGRLCCISIQPLSQDPALGVRRIQPLTLEEGAKDFKVICDNPGLQVPLIGFTHRLPENTTSTLFLWIQANNRKYIIDPAEIKSSNATENFETFLTRQGKELDIYRPTIPNLATDKTECTYFIAKDREISFDFKIEDLNKCTVQFSTTQTFVSEKISKLPGLDKITRAFVNGKSMKDFRDNMLNVSNHPGSSVEPMVAPSAEHVVTPITPEEANSPAQPRKLGTIKRTGFCAAVVAAIAAGCLRSWWTHKEKSPTQKFMDDIVSYNFGENKGIDEFRESGELMLENPPASLASLCPRLVKISKEKCLTITEPKELPVKVAQIEDENLRYFVALMNIPGCCVMEEAVAEDFAKHYNPILNDITAIEKAKQEIEYLIEFGKLKPSTIKYVKKALNIGSAEKPSTEAKNTESKEEESYDKMAMTNLRGTSPINQ